MVITYLWPNVITKGLVLRYPEHFFHERKSLRCHFGIEGFLFSPYRVRLRQAIGEDQFGAVTCCGVAAEEADEVGDGVIVVARGEIQT